MTQPRLKLAYDFWDYFLEVSGLIFLILLMLWPTIHFSSLPEIIPTHFNGFGKADGFGSKATVWTLPVIGLGLFIFLFFLNKYPHVFNYPVKITAENAKYQYGLATKMMRMLNTVVIAMFFFIELILIESAKRGELVAGMNFIFMHVIVIFVSIGVYLYLSRKKDHPTPDAQEN